MVDDGRSGPSSETDPGAVSEKVVAGLAMNTGECFYSSGWDPMVSLTQTENFGTTSMVVPKWSEIGGGNFSEMVSSFGVPGYGQSYTGICPEKYASNKNMAIEKASTGLIPSPNGKRKRLSGSSSPPDTNMAVRGDQDRDLSGETVEPKESDEKRRRMEQTGKQVKDISQDGEEPKDNYIHVRARRGQATNSHSLAERVRREKISQRMRLLQELVPGCNKITGKAVMLDEIINYVQSLQQQVEFLSMKLATVNPELNFDIDRILSKDILHLRGGVPPVLGFNTGPSSSNPYPPGIHQGALPGVSTTPAYHPVPQGMWDGEMQGMYHMGFDSNAGVVNLGPNGSSKPEAR